MLEYFTFVLVRIVLVKFVIDIDFSKITNKITHFAELYSNPIQMGTVILIEI